MPDYILPSRGGRVETGIAGINKATTGTSVLVAGVAGKRIAIMGMLVVAGGTVVVKLYGDTDATPSDPADLLNGCGAFSFTIGTGFALPSTEDPACAYFVTDVGDGVYINLSADVQVSGVVRYAYL